MNNVENKLTIDRLGSEFLSGVVAPSSMMLRLTFCSRCMFTLLRLIVGLVIVWPLTIGLTTPRAGDFVDSLFVDSRPDNAKTFLAFKNIHKKK